jgi:hypothetical protein
MNHPESHRPLDGTAVTNRVQVTGVIGVAAVLSLAVPSLAAQVPGIPSYHRFTTRGVGLAIDYGFAGPNVIADFDAWGVTATLGVGPPNDSSPTSARLFNLGASLSRFMPRGGARTTVWGLQAGVAWDYLHVGFARWDSVGTTHWRAPIALGTPLVGCVFDAASVIFWGSARLDVDHVSTPGTGARTIARPGFVLGIHLELRNGIGLQAAGDQPRVLGKKTWIFGAGVHYARHSLPRAVVRSQEKCRIAFLNHA